jgi:hypothetical protein
MTAAMTIPMRRMMVPETRLGTKEAAVSSPRFKESSSVSATFGIEKCIRSITRSPLLVNSLTGWYNLI